MAFNTACFDLYSTQNAKPHYVIGKPEDDLYRSKHVVLKIINFYCYYYIYNNNIVGEITCASN